MVRLSRQRGYLPQEKIDEIIQSWINPDWLDRMMMFPPQPNHNVIMRKFVQIALMNWH